MLTRLSLAAVLAVLLTVAACSSEQPAATSALGVPEAALPDGATFAWLSSVTTEDVVVDPAELLSGEAARKAAIEAGVIAEGEELPNDFFIADPDDETFTVGVASDASYELMLFVEGSPVATEVSVDEVMQALEGSNPDVYGVADGVIPAMVTIADGRVTRISQVYLP